MPISPEAGVPVKHIVGVLLIGLVLTACGSPEGAGPGDTGVATPVASGGESIAVSACKDMSTTGTSTVMVDWVDFVRLDGVEYLAGVDGVAPVSSAQTGPVVGRVRCQLSALKFTRRPGPAVDGDAAFLPIGTELRAVAGYSTSCRITATVDGVDKVYVAHRDVGGSSNPAPCSTPSLSSR